MRRHITDVWPVYVPGARCEARTSKEKPLQAPDWQAAARHPWDTTLSGLRADALDCLQTTVALVADHAHGPGTHLALGCRWRFPEADANGAARIQMPVQDRFAEAMRLLGLRAERIEASDGPAVRDQLAGGQPLYVIADAFLLPWLPYAGHAHMSHSFLIEPFGERFLVVDAYHNDTQWGPARPGAWTLSPTAVDQVIAGDVTTMDVRPATGPLWLDRSKVLADNATLARAAKPATDAYTERLRERLAEPGVIDDVVLDIWLLSRERSLHAAWLADHPAARQVSARAEAWQRLSTQSYLVARRMRRGGRPNPVLIDDLARLLHEDMALAIELAEPSTVDDAVDAVVLAELCATLGLDEAVVRATDTLRSLPGFDSFRLVDAIDRIEQRLDTALPDDLAVDDLRDVAGLCRLFRSAKHQAKAVSTG
ncbi:phosphopantetheine-binding protein [Kibdelosporangium persicum]|uniref:Phosphopantetheine-binding n=1 Tax=Kibdelosporangium persicum TaxID=2698649 RepID=A0ABX2FDG1_9PSEU|nr:Phosphopantetheine-binding [Kibdelosporangium persicum]